MRINREELLKVLESVSPGLASKETIEQSTCFAFRDGNVFTFNDEIACCRKTTLSIEGAVKADKLLILLGKLTEDEIDIEQIDSELKIKGKKRRASFRMETEVVLPIESLETPEEWRDLDPEFGEAISLVHSCAEKDESQFILTCVHITSEFIEACDRYQVARYPVKTGVEESVLVKADSIRKMVGYDMTEISETKSWMHFRNPVGVQMSCRRYIGEDYSDLDTFISSDGVTPITLPGGISEAVSKAEIFSSENATGNRIKINLRSDRMVIRGEGSSGSFEEIKSVKYTGPPIKFMISPKLFIEISKKSNECGISKDRLFVDTGKFKYATCTEVEEKV